MAKKCAPGVICIENVTLILLILFVLIGLYIWYISYILPSQKQLSTTQHSLSSVTNNVPMLLPISSKQDIFNDPYQPPLKKKYVSSS